MTIILIDLRFLRKSRKNLQIQNLSSQAEEVSQGVAQQQLITRIKIGVAIALAAASLFVFLPFTKFANKKGGKLFDHMTSFAAGMLLSISVVHILPEATEMYQHYQEANPSAFQGKFPWPYVLFYFGFLFMLLLDQVAFKGPNSLNEIDEVKPVEQIIIQEETDAVRGSRNDNYYKIDAAINSSPIQKSEKERAQDHYRPEANQHVQRLGKSTIFVFGAAIIFHSFVDGLAIGVFNELSDLAVLTASVVIHKVPIACTVGTTLASNGQSLKQRSTQMVCLLFILASPVGTLTGMILDGTSPNIGLVIVQGMSGGVFAYLACCDLVVHQFHDAKSASKTERLTKYVAMSLGAAIVIGLIAVAPAHSH